MESQNIKFQFVSADGEARDVEGQIGETVMEVAYATGIKGIAAECGGSMSCGTCHVFLDKASFERIEAPSESELDMLDIVSSDRRPTSRLSCQIKLTPEFVDAEVHIPESQY
ncbi:2Fe-2S iron-sulfur cluster-binding protein [Sphingopyxis flava]|uniref:Ferredoxin, 2Fe-2S n=1 Tax=Sphingopyxis flava TaxID=1507287 RepID=A0A1T5E737_9SPHN|nr:2Fe-2S iron-sulfur cluster-binding protein [Sphingopyxis flava]SKB79744.1 ferredoxin, 2Fe-2S [Sphingopyxis flava]